MKTVLSESEFWERSNRDRKIKKNFILASDVFLKFYNSIGRLPLAVKGFNEIRSKSPWNNFEYSSKFVLDGKSI